MHWYHWVFWGSLGTGLAVSGYHLYRLFRLGVQRDLATPAGSTPAAIRYSFSGAMNPARKESAFMHLPTYTAGILYHLGTFLSLGLMFFLFTEKQLPPVLKAVITLFLITSVACGAGILSKRGLKKGMRELSGPDDYLSNILVTAFQLMTAITLNSYAMLPGLYVSASLLFLYLPLGKLKHAFYFFIARYQLGLFFGRRGVWPPRKSNSVYG